MNVFGFALDPIAQMPVVILKDSTGENSIPIWIGSAESFAFAAELLGREISSSNGRKDLFERMLEQMGMRIETISVDSLLDGKFLATIHLVGGNGEQTTTLSVLASEAITLALKCRMPVMVNDTVLQQASTVDMNDECFAKENNARRFVDFLENLDPSSMGKYPM
jgi:bifunctional DNase/RNase